MVKETPLVFNRKLSQNNQNSYRTTLPPEIIESLDLDTGQSLYQHIHETEDGREGIFISPEDPRE